MEPILQVQHLTHTYSVGTPFQRSAVEDMSFDVYDGEFLGIIGHTGSGKSTLIQHLNGLLRPTSGQILLHGKDIWAEPKKIRDVRFQVGLVFQYPEYQLFEETVYKDIAFGPRNMKLDEQEIDRRVHSAIDFVNLPESVLQQSPFELSGGQKRRVAIAGVLAMAPKVLILDEPTAGLDPQGVSALLELLASLRDGLGMTILMATHDMDVVPLCCDYAYLLGGGSVLAQGTPEELFAQAELLRANHLRLPRIAHLMAILRDRDGLDVAPVGTIGAARRELLRLLKQEELL
mgnify:CR=1 FL=1